MAESEEPKEQRKHKRFSLKEWVSGFCRTSFFGVGTLVDIGRGGVAFQYVQPSGDDWDLLTGSIELDLFKSEPSRNVIGIDCNVVYDTAAPWEIGVFGNYQLRRCGVEFGELSSDQSAELDSFIKDFTVEGN
jgi:hypothetical protein